MFGCSFSITSYLVSSYVSEYRALKGLPGSFGFSTQFIPPFELRVDSFHLWDFRENAAKVCSLLTKRHCCLLLALLAQSVT